MDARSERTRRLLDEVFGDTLPDTTSDERPDPADWAERRGADLVEQDLLDPRPPHHDRDG